MNELKSNKKHLPPNKVKDAVGLNSLLGFLNNSAITGAQVPKGAIVNAIPESSGTTEPVKAAPVVEQPTPLPQSASQGPVAPISLSKIVFTGRLMSGKDFVSGQAGLKIFSLAEPLYTLQKFFFGTDDKTVPGAREFLQTSGQWGRGEVNKQYPLTPERAMFVKFIRTGLPSEFDALGVSWKLFGADPDLWLNALLARVDDHLEKNPGARVAVSNCRFENEIKRLTAEGFVHRHVLCSASTWTTRLKTAGLTPESPACKDLSERLASALDGDVTRKLSQQKTGSKLAAIWCDERVPAPSNRLFTVAEFVAQFPK